jgi:sortase A
MNTNIPIKSKYRLKHKILGVLIILGLIFCGKGLYMQSKAFVAQQLLSFAWARHLQDGQLYKAWPWADSAPLAKLTFPGKDPLIILSGATGSNLAFAPSWMLSSTPFAQGGNSVIVAHNDTHFNQLKGISVDDKLQLSTYGNERLFYQVMDMKVIDETDVSVIENNGDELLTLITCYPFDSAIYNSDQRFVVIAKRVKDDRSPITLTMVDNIKNYN